MITYYADYGNPRSAENYEASVTVPLAVLLFTHCGPVKLDRVAAKDDGASGDQAEVASPTPKC